MRISLPLVVLGLLTACTGSVESPSPSPAAPPENEFTEATVEMLTEPDSLLRHAVFFKFKDSSSAKDVEEVRRAFSALPAKIDAIVDYEWGTNNSPEGLNKDFTHAFFVTFADEAGRAAYLPHPDHQAFVEILRPHLEDVFVMDYWARND